MTGGHRATASVPPEAHAAALAAAPGLHPGALRRVLRRWEPAEAWDRLRRGVWVDPGGAADPHPGATPEGEPASLFPGGDRLPAESRPTDAERRRRRQEWAAAFDVAEAWAAYRASGVEVALLGTLAYPSLLAGDHQAPAVIFWRGDLEALAARRVAMVGTRRCSTYGRDVARQLGQELAEHDVAVVSGLAWGIDGAAHEGALRASPGGRPVAVVGSGLDVPYPRRHRQLWERLAERGVVLSEAPLGARPLPWRFPLRNRLIAALAEVVVVVESRASGGSLSTVAAADVRGRTILAVPGSIRSPASVGTNLLLRDGNGPVLDVHDVLTALGLSEERSGDLPPGDGGRRPGALAVQDGGCSAIEREVLDAMGWEPATVDTVAARTGRPVAELAIALVTLESGGLVTSENGWWERRAAAGG